MAERFGLFLAGTGKLFLGSEGFGLVCDKGLETDISAGGDCLKQKD